MDFTIIYEYSFRSNKILLSLPLLIFVITSVAAIIFIKKAYPKFSVLRQATLLFFWIMFCFSSIMTIIAVVRIPGVLKEERNSKEALASNHCPVIEGLVEDFKSVNINGRCTESFRIGKIKFKYSDHVHIIGFNQTSNENGPIRNNGQYLRIHYVNKENENYILRIEVPKEK